MGCSFHIHCPECENEFYWNDGVGKRIEVLHCDKCGKELWTTDKFLVYKNLKCVCGGYYDKAVPVICPGCGFEIDRPRQYIYRALEWD